MRARLASWLTWAIVLAATHGVLLQFREGDPNQAHVALVFLLVVLGGSASGARGLGASLAAAAFVLINYYYQQPFGTLSVDKSLDWVVLIAFLATAIAAAELVQQARDHAKRADARTEEVLRLGAEARRAAALEEADRLKDALLASVSHDLRTPLTTIRALASDLPDGPETAAREIMTQVDRLDRMVRDVLDFSRTKAGPAPALEINTVEDLVGATIRQLAGSLKEHQVRTTVVDDAILIGKFDFASSLRALSNLVDNAARYSPAPAPIDIVVRRDDAFVAIDVADRGPGLPAGEEERVFLPFYRPSGSPPDGGSAGLGLAIARNVAEAQGGTASYARRDGGGSVFTLRLLRADEN